MAKKQPQRIRVPSKPVLVRMIREVDRDHKRVFDKDFNEYLRRHTRYFDALCKGDPAIVAWHEAAYKEAKLSFTFGGAFLQNSGE